MARGHSTRDDAAMKILQSGYGWPTFVYDYTTCTRQCDACYKVGK